MQKGPVLEPLEMGSYFVAPADFGARGSPLQSAIIGDRVGGNRR